MAFARASKNAGVSRPIQTKSVEFARASKQAPPRQFSRTASSRATEAIKGSPRAAAAPPAKTNMRVSQSARTRQSFMREAMRDYPVPAREELHKLWERFDYNGNGLLSLAEIDKLVREEYPQYDDKQALLRAYKFADQDGSGFITKNEFATLVRSLAYFKALAEEFREVDASGDRRIDFDEFLAGAPRMGLNLGEAEARAIFDKMDADGGGLVLFEEFCAFINGFSSRSKSAG